MALGCVGSAYPPFQNDSSTANLDQWRIYEEEDPDTFIGMYQFWTQKKH